jgi:hypothetical protein
MKARNASELAGLLGHSPNNWRDRMCGAEVGSLGHLT